MPLLEGLDYLNVGILEPRSDPKLGVEFTGESDYKYGIECIISWLRKHQTFFKQLYLDVK